MSNFTNDEDYDTGLVFEWSTDFYDFQGSRTKFTPSEEIQRTGLKIGEPWARVWHNDAMFNFSQYAKWLSGDPVIERNSTSEKPIQVENFEPIGTVKVINQEVRVKFKDPNSGEFLTEFTVDDARLFWGGTWEKTDTGTFTKHSMDTHQDLGFYNTN